MRASASMRILAAEPPGAEKPPTLPPAASTLWAGDDQRHRILRHGLADIARGFRSGAEFLGQGPIGCRAPPSDPSRRGIDALEECSCSPRSSLNLEKSVSSPSK